MTRRPLSPHTIAAASSRRVRALADATSSRVLLRLTRAVMRALAALDPVTAPTGRRSTPTELVDAERARLLRDIRVMASHGAMRVDAAALDALAAGWVAGWAAAGGRPGPHNPPPTTSPVDHRALTITTTRWADDIYRRVTDDAARAVVAPPPWSTPLTRREASLRMVQTLTAAGVHGFTDRAGRRWELGAYAEMAVRAATMQAALDGHTAALVGSGIVYGMVSDHSEECALCRPWEGRILALTAAPHTGRTPDGRVIAGTITDARDAGVWHPGCRHTLLPYIPGESGPAPRRTADPEGDRLRRQHRARERRVRVLARRVAVAQAAADAREAGGQDALRRARADLAAYRRDFAAWREAHDRKHLRYREHVTHR